MSGGISNNINDYPTVGDFFVAQIQDGIFGIIGTTFAPLTASMHSLLVATMVCSLVVFGIRITLNDSKASKREFVVTLIWGMTSLGIVEPEFYQKWIVDTVWSLADGFASLMLSGEFGNLSLFGAISKSFQRVFYFVGELFKVWSVTNVLPLLIGIVTGAFYGIFYAYMLVLVLFVNVILGIMFILGAIIIPLAAFEMWRAVFKSWIQSILKYSAVSLFVATIALISNKLVVIAIGTLSMEALNADSYYEHLSILSSSLAVLLLTACFGVALLKKTMELTGEVTGGVMSDTRGAVGGAVGDTASAIKGIGAAGRGISAIAKLKAKTPTP